MYHVRYFVQLIYVLLLLQGRLTNTVVTPLAGAMWQWGHGAWCQELSERLPALCYDDGNAE